MFRIIRHIWSVEKQKQANILYNIYRQIKKYNSGF